MKIKEEHIVYHVVTERPMELNQVIIFDENHHNGVYERVMEKSKLIQDIYNNPSNYNYEELDHHTKVALRELAMEEVRKQNYPMYPSRMNHCMFQKELMMHIIGLIILLN